MPPAAFFKWLEQGSEEAWGTTTGFQMFLPWAMIMSLLVLGSLKLCLHTNFHLFHNHFIVLIHQFVLTRKFLVIRLAQKCLLKYGEWLEDKAVQVDCLSFVKTQCVFSLRVHLSTSWDRCEQRLKVTPVVRLQHLFTTVLYIVCKNLGMVACSLISK